MKRMLIMTFLIFLVSTGISQDNKKNSISLGFGSVVSDKADGHHRVGIAMNDEHRLLILGQFPVRVHVSQFQEEIAAQRHIPHAGRVWYGSHIRVTFVPVVGNAQSRVDEHQLADVFRLA